MPNHLFVVLRATPVLLCILLGAGVALAAGSKSCDAFTTAQAELIAAQKDFMACTAATKGNFGKCKEKGRRVVDLTKQLKGGADAYCDSKPPCDDETLRPAMKTAKQWPTYIDPFPTTICEVKDDPDNCTVEKVFELMIGTPAAIGPAKDPESQTVEDCGILLLDAFTDPLLPKKYERPNPIRVDIDEEHHRVTNYTMPDHVFWPGLVIREIVERNGKIGVKTTGYGHEDVIKKWLVNLPTAGLAWAFCDGVLIGTYNKTYGGAQSDNDG